MVMSRCASVIILHFVGLIFMPHLLHAFSYSLVNICNLSKTRSTRVVSSAIADVVNAHLTHLNAIVQIPKIFHDKVPEIG